jgi:hypothetical protein
MDQAKGHGKRTANAVWGRKSVSARKTFDSVFVELVVGYK